MRKEHTDNKDLNRTLFFDYFCRHNTINHYFYNLYIKPQVLFN